MKKMIRIETFLKKLMTAILVSLCPFLANAAGGTSGVGGDFIPGTNVTAVEVQLELERLRPALRAHLQFLELMAIEPESGMSGSLQKLFGGPVTIFDKVELVKVNVQASGPCLDFNHEEKDATADPNDTSFCLSISNATEKLVSENLHRQLVALAIHELGHMVGMNEDEAKALQKYILSMTASATTHTLPLKLSSLKSEIAELQKQLKSLLATIPQADKTKTCDSLTDTIHFSERVSNKFSVFSEFGMLPLRLQPWIEGAATNLTARIANNFCSTNGVPTSSSNLGEILKDSSPTYAPYYQKVLVTIVGNGDWIALSKAIAEMQARLDMLLEQIRLVEANPSILAELDPNNSGCFDANGLVCTLKPGLVQGQRYKIENEFLLPKLGIWTYFSGGQMLSEDSIRATEGLDYCSINISQSGDGKRRAPESLKVAEGIRVPGKLEVTLHEISWFVETVFFETDIANEKFGLVVFCGKVRNGHLKSVSGDTSLANIGKAFGGNIQLIKQ